jgi:putative phosphoesterase
VRVAAISDIHGNLPALEAVLADIEDDNVDAIVVAGDTISGPWPAEVFDLVVAADALVVRGNADRLVLERDDQYGQLAAWSADRLGKARLAVAAEWPLTVELAMGSLGPVLVCHSTPVSDDPIYTRITPDEDVLAMLGPVRPGVVVCGHTHMQYDRTLDGGLRVVNPGSVGLPYEGERGAYWALLEDDVQFRRTEYDVEAAVVAVRDMRTPVDEELLQYLLEPPDSITATEYFESLRVS